VRRSKRGRSALARTVACLLLVLIGADLVGDTNCDAAPVSGGDPGLRILASSPTGRTGEACQDVCVPDCFCCCRSLATDPPAPPAPPEPRTAVPSRARGHGLAGVRPVIDHPPLVLA